MWTTSEDRETLRRLFTEERVLSLAVLLDGTPYVGLLPFAVRPNFSALLVLASRLARHSAGLAPGAEVGLLIQQPDRPGTDPFALARVSLQGRSSPLREGDPDYASGREIYLAKLPGAERSFQLGDFRLFEISLQKGRFVASFGRIYNLSAATLRQLEG